MRDEGGDAVVVTEADLVVGDGVVLVDDGQHTKLQQPGDRLAGVQVLAAVHEVEGRQQDLPGGHVVAAEVGAPELHEPRLADGRHRLQRGHIARATAGEAQGGQAGSDGTRAHQHDLVAGDPARGHLVGQLGHGLLVDVPLGVGYGGCADLDDDNHVSRS